MDLMRLLRVVELSPGGGHQDVDIMELRPARAGSVQGPAALHHPLLDVLNGLLTLGFLKHLNQNILSEQYVMNMLSSESFGLVPV